MSTPCSRAVNSNAAEAAPQWPQFIHDRNHVTEVRATILAAFDYNCTAELFPARNRKFGRQPLGYRRFEQAADAIRFAIEELPPELLLGACLEVDEERYDRGGIRRLYESADYPLIRRAAGLVATRGVAAQ
jgi:hypothetical protein